MPPWPSPSSSPTTRASSWPPAEHLAVDPVLTTVVSTVTQRAARRTTGRRSRAGPPAVVGAVARDGSGEVAGVAMRTAPFAPAPALRAADARRRRARPRGTLHARGEEVGGVNGALPAARVVAERPRLTVLAEVSEHTRLFELGDLVEPASPPAGCAGDAGRTRTWRSLVPGLRGSTPSRPAGPRRRTAVSDYSTTTWPTHRRSGGLALGGRRGEVVHLTGPTRRAFGVARIGPVYTPKEHAARGTRARPSPQVSRLLLDAAGAGLPVHRPGQPDLEQDLPGARATSRWSTWRTRGSAA